MEKNQKIKGILFDLDGTLVDTAPDFILSLNNILFKHKYPRLDDQLIRSHVSDGSKKLTSLGFGINEDDPDFNMLRIKEPFEITLLRNCRQIPLTLTFRLKEFLGAMFLYFLQTAP